MRAFTATYSLDDGTQHVMPAIAHSSFDVIDRLLDLYGLAIRKLTVRPT